jgi:hypothetical protein
MARRSYKFTVKTHDEFGTLGFAPKWYPSGDPLSGMAVAHDILEHFPGDPGDAEGEFMALGAAYWIRGESGFMQRNGNRNPPEEHIASDFPMIWRIHHGTHGRTGFRSPPRTRGAVDIIDQCKNIVYRACRLLSEEECERLPDAAERELIAQWLARGYVLAERRYKKIDPCISGHDIAYSLFGRIEEQADRLLTQAEEGMELTVNIDVRALSVSLSLDYPEYD